MQPPDSVMVRNRRAVIEQRIVGDVFDRHPLFDLAAGLSGRNERVVRRRTVGIHMGETTGDDAPAALALHRLAHVVDNRVM